MAIPHTTHGARAGSPTRPAAGCHHGRSTLAEVVPIGGAVHTEAQPTANLASWIARAIASLRAQAAPVDAPPRPPSPPAPHPWFTGPPAA